MGYKIDYSVYKIKNTITNQCYIGVDSYYPKRIKQHQSRLRNNKHRNKHLQSSYNKYGIENFTFELLLKCDSREEMLQKEIKLISYYNSLKDGFNHTIGGEGSFGYKHSKETLLKMKGGDYSFTQTQEFRDKISTANKGKKKKPYKRKNHPDYSKWVGGEKHPVAKFKWVEINEMRKLYSCGTTLNELAIKFDTSKTYICNIVNNLFWKDDNYTKDIITKHIICIEDNLEFNNVKEVKAHYSISHTPIYNSFTNNKKIKTKYGNKTFKKVSVEEALSRFA